jgi:hypothetical protein
LQSELRGERGKRGKGSERAGGSEVVSVEEGGGEEGEGRGRGGGRAKLMVGVDGGVLILVLVGMKRGHHHQLHSHHQFPSQH